MVAGLASPQVDAAFVLVVNKRVDAPAPRSGPGRTDLGFVAQGQRTWTDAGGAVTLSMWQRSPVGSSSPQSWHETHGSITFVTGELLFPGAAAEPAGWAERVASLGATRSFSEVQRELRGIFASVHLDDRGNGWVLSDPHGLRCLYTAEDDDAVIVSSRAALVARAMSKPPDRDVVNACWFSYTGYHVGPATGYCGVRVVAPGSVLTLHRGRASWVHRPALTEPVDEGAEPVVALADRVLADVAYSLHSVLDQGGPEPVIRLTGGKDSRLVLAAALHVGIAHEFRYETIGWPGLADADIASELANRLRPGTHGPQPTSGSPRLRCRRRADRAPLQRSQSRSPSR